MFTFASKPLPIFNVVVEGIKLFSHTFSRIWYWSFLFHFLNSLPNIMQSITGDAYNNKNTISVEYLFFYLLAFIVQLYGSIFIMHRIYSIGSESNPNRTTLDSLKIGKNKLLPVFLASGLLLAILACTVFLIGGLLKLSNLTGQSEMIWFVILFAPPLIFLSILFIFYLPLVIFQNATAIEALKKSVLLVWGSWWNTLLVPLIPSIIGLLLIAFAFFIQPKNAFGISLSMMVISSIIAPLTYSLILTQFNNLNLLKNQKPFNEASQI